MGRKLIKLTKAYEKQLGEMIDEWKADQAQNHTNGSPWAIFKNDYHDFDRYLRELEIKEPGDGKVPDSTFFLLDEERDRLLGAVNIRHYLNAYLLREGGHIGDGIRPSERRKGYGTELLKLALIECKALGISRALVVCDRNNVGSAKAIQRNGGVLENEFVNEDGGIGQRYWIQIGSDPHAIDSGNRDPVCCGPDCETGEPVCAVRTDAAQPGAFAEETHRKSILIKDTTREQRERIVREALFGACGADCEFCSGCDNLGGGRIDAIYQPYIDGEQEIAEINAAYRAPFVR